jgi:hypothetical protein
MYVTACSSCFRSISDYVFVVKSVFCVLVDDMMFCIMWLFAVDFQYMLYSNVECFVATVTSRKLI